MRGNRPDFGPLAKRSQRSGIGAPTPTARRVLPTAQFAEVRDAEQWVPGLLVAWERGADGSWWGRIVVAVDGEASEFLCAGSRLRPVTVVTSNE